MAGETGTQGAAGSEFPVFKSSEGAFDRAKYEEQDKARIVSDGITARPTGKEIDEDLVKKKKSADQVIKEANKFYDDSFQKNVKGLDPAYDPSLIYYSEAYSDGGSNKNKIRRKLEKGETIDGKEIFEMSKQAAENKISNAQVLKDGRVTDIVENLGLKDVKQFDLFEDVKSDFDSKVKDEKIKFDPLLNKFAQVLDYFGVKDSFMASQYAPILYTPENMAIISALGKVLEAEGFTNESVTKMAKAYDDNIKKLIEKKEGKKAEDIIKEAGEEAKKEGEAKVEEQKLDEKSTPAPTGTTGEGAKPLEGTQETQTGVTGASTTASTTTTTETLTTVTSTTGPTGPTGSQEPSKVEGAKTSTTGTTGSKPVTSSDVTKRQEDLLSSLFGIKFAESGTGATGSTGGTETTPKKKKEETTLEKKVEEKKTETAQNTTTTPTTSTTETKLEEKISSNNQTENETSSVNTPIKETEQQNLSSVISPEKESTDMDKNNTEGNKGTTTTTTETKTTETKTEGGEGGTSSASSLETNKTSEDKAATEEKQKADKEMADDIKSMVNLLTQLNSTLQNPLMVIPNGKKFN